MSEEYNPFKIDENALDEEWLRQARLSRRAGHREADARHDHAKAKARLDVVRAKAAKRIRLDPESYDLSSRPNADAIKDTVVLEADVQEAVRELDQAKYNLDIASADVSAMVDRRKALERLVELLALDYYSEREPQAHSVQARQEISNRTRRAARGSVDSKENDRE